MPNVAFVRITRSYQFVQRIIGAWALKCDKLIVYEHEGEKTEKIHVHILMFGMIDTWDNFKKIAKKLLPDGEEFKGNEDWSIKKKYEYRPNDTIKYMSKGHLEPVYNKGYTDEEVALAKAAWVPAEDKRTKDQEMYHEFCGGDDYDKQQISAAWDFDVTKREARRYAFAKCNGVWSARAGQISRMLIFTHYMNWSFVLPDSWETRM